MKKCLLAVAFAGLAIICPIVLPAQNTGLSGEVLGLQSVLDRLYDEMLPMCSQLIGVGRGIAGFAAIWYIAVRVWRHLSL
ncbi:MAG: conjugative transposon protein TraJ, partial [Chitinophagaceae bacterium]